MSDTNKYPSMEIPEQIWAEVDRRESGDPPRPMSATDEATIRDLQAEFETLLTELREPPPVDLFLDESDCRRAIELVERLAETRVLADEHPDLDRIGPYQVVTRVAHGGMGTVYKAFHTKLKRVVAVKVLPASRTQDAAAVARFEREMEVIGKLNHRHIVAAVDAGEADAMHYLVMEYVDGVDLSTLVRRVGPLAPADACEIARQAALGLKEAHAHGIVHRDIKPSNLILADAGPSTAEPVVKILDFGLARLGPLAATDDELTVSGQIMGTLKYMAPEQCSRSHDVDIRADIYSLGATLYRMLSGESPFSTDQFDSPLALVAALASVEPVSLSRRRGDLPRQVVEVVERMMAKNPDKRFLAPDDVVVALTPLSQSANLTDLLGRARASETAATSDISMSQVRAAASSPAPAQQNRSNTALPRLSLPQVFVFIGAVVATAIATYMLAKSLNETPASQHTQDADTEKQTATTNAVERTAAAPSTSSDPFQRARDAAEWLVSQRANLGLGAEGPGFVELKPGDQVPKQGFHLQTASLAGNKSITDEDLARFGSLPFFVTLVLNDTNIGDEGLRRLGDLPLLQYLYLSQTKITDAGLAELTRFPQLKMLHLFNTAVTDAGMQHLVANQNLTELYLVRCRISDEGLKHLSALKNLKSVQLQETSVTAQGIATLRTALPECQVGTTISEAEIAAAMAAQQNNSNSQQP
jgi:serine/threonine protein kinase